MIQVTGTANALGCGLVREVLHLAGHARIRVTGSSMLPCILPGDVLEIRRSTISELHPGDIALFSRRERIFAHRIIAAEVFGDVPFLITRGDTHRRNDSPVFAHQLLGQVTSIVRGKSRREPRATFWRRLVSMFLRHSQLLTRFLVFGVNARRISGERPAWQN
jgi:signal peptidase I